MERHAQVASKAKAVPDEYGPDAERQDVRRDEPEFRTAQQQVKPMTQARAGAKGARQDNAERSISHSSRRGEIIPCTQQGRRWTKS